MLSRSLLLEPGTVEFQVYLDEPGATEGSPKKGPTCLGAVNKRLSGEIDNIVMDITPHAERLMDADHNRGLTLVPKGGVHIEIQSAHVALMIGD